MFVKNLSTFIHIRYDTMGLASGIKYVQHITSQLFSLPLPLPRIYMVNIYRSNQAESVQNGEKIEMFRPILFGFRFSLSILYATKCYWFEIGETAIFLFFLFYSCRWCWYEWCVWEHILCMLVSEWVWVWVRARMWKIFYVL